ncbi:hypothetical protein HD806DRAFT_500240 [Xylariaceae sp. AK1471]|nr:hypothetical protein HD806DRAFT_500240 [Xylariaceae sp. AK1471]
MDPASAFGIAGSVAQFITFASTLIRKANEVYRSSNGLSDDITNIEKVYDKLQELSLSLDVPPNACTTDDRELEGQFATVVELSRSCKVDCQLLLSIITKLKVENGPRRNWRNFQSVVKAQFKESEISQLEDRLKRAQTTLILQLCSISSHYHALHLEYSRKIHAETVLVRLGQASNLDNIKSILQQVQQQIEFIEKQLETQTPLCTNIEKIGKQLSALTLAENSIEKSLSIIQSLAFERQTFRHGDIKEAHRETFEWIFWNRQNGNHNFGEWLRNDSRIFWISGKPGSGKSTLVKFIAGHHRTAQELSAWSYPRPVCIVSHYFWSGGSVLQKSEQGLLQTLLYDIFRRCPDLLAKSCPERWSSATNKSTNDNWSLIELRDVLKNIATQSDIPMRFCFFIDGLDEYDGDHIDLCQAIQDLSVSPNIKLCVSSRPWNIFKDSFGTNSRQKLDIHELTKDDIYKYTEFRLYDHPRWGNFVSEEPYAASLITEITQRSQGVFLWVFLVTKRLRDGLTNDDSVSDMRRRLDDFPTDLEPFFRHMLETVDQIYSEKMSGMLSIAVKAAVPLDDSIYHFHNQEYGDENYSQQVPIQAIDEETMRAQRLLITRRLNGWCMGLLEVRNGRVGFLHKTVLDYLRTAEMTKFLKSRNKENFHASLSILRAYTAWIKTTPATSQIIRRGPGSYNDVPLTTRTIEAFQFARDIEDEEYHTRHNLAKNMLLDDIEATLCIIDSREGRAFPARSNIHSNGAKLFFREQIINANLIDYISAKIGKTGYYNDFERTPLSMVVHSDLWKGKTDRSIVGPQRKDKTVPMVELLLNSGEDPNEQCEIHTENYSTMSSWALLVDWFVDAPFFSQTLRKGLFSLFLKHKADPNALVWQTASCDCIKDQVEDEEAAAEACDCKSFITVWKKLLGKSFSVTPMPDPELYLGLLDDFLKYGADSQMPSSGTAQSGDIRYSQKETIMHYFFQQLGRIAYTSEKKVNLELLSAVIAKLLSSSPPEALEEDVISKSIYAVFPRAVAIRLERLLPTKTRSHMDDEAEISSEDGISPCVPERKRKRAMMLSYNTLAAQEKPRKKTLTGSKPLCPPDILGQQPSLGNRRRERSLLRFEFV